MIGGSGDNLNRIITISSTTPGAEYNFRYRVSNIYGWSLGYSSELSILSATPPDTPDVAVTSISSSYVKIDWDKPNENFALITAYMITILDTNGDQ